MIQEITFVKTFMHELYICTTTCPYEYRYAAAIGNCAHSQNLLDIRIIMQIKSAIRWFQQNFTVHSLPYCNSRRLWQLGSRSFVAPSLLTCDTFCTQLIKVLRHGYGRTAKEKNLYPIQQSVRGTIASRGSARGYEKFCNDHYDQDRDRKKNYREPRLSNCSWNPATN